MNTLVGLGATASFGVSCIAAAMPHLGWKTFFEEPAMLLGWWCKGGGRGAGQGGPLPALDGWEDDAATSVIGVAVYGASLCMTSAAARAISVSFAAYCSYLLCACVDATRHRYALALGR